MVAPGSPRPSPGRTGWILNHVTSGGAAPQMEISTNDTATVRISDSGLAQGDEDGVYAQCSGSSTLQLVNLTVADNSGIGLDLRQNTTSTVSLYNTISFGNSTDLSTSGTIDSGTYDFASGALTCTISADDGTTWEIIARVGGTAVTALTDSTGGTANDTLVAISGSGDDAEINNNFADLSAKVNELRTACENAGVVS